MVHIRHTTSDYVCYNYSTVQTQVYTRKSRTLVYSNSHSHSKCESSKITRENFAREKQPMLVAALESRALLSRPRSSKFETCSSKAYWS